MKLGYNFYQQDALTVAKELLGTLLVRELEEEKIVCKIVETEAYLGAEDKGCHAYQNKRTDRTEVMFNSGGCVYIYLIYGIHNLLNVVVNSKNVPEAVLIRAVEPIRGIEMIKKNRNIKSDKRENLTNGPGKLSQALDIDRGLNGYNLVTGDKLYIEQEETEENYELVCSKRINIDYAEEYKDKLWRFYIKNNSFVSA
ncbi:DNA-3-methyladenine glycosylase [Halanaerobacter jeridensis]|uniref:Putative 3-methyladenine DNA glycosylase n=1 Tax=Halanaerobacter jeridensis TaxID=706427 RepID=A0A938XRQ7_9FIRM|nr:DNA-3-methyladenine glycosylase [Halanaerobacter jeridensis]MBM7556456.1 DNA-3-methyladenine glycosylase [Halanaerobacter jeridensis]